MTLPLRWRIASAVTSLLAVAALAAPAGGANVTTVTLTDAVGDTQPSTLPQADITSSTATFKPTEIAFTLVTSAPRTPASRPTGPTRARRSAGSSARRRPRRPSITNCATR